MSGWYDADCDQLSLMPVYGHGVLATQTQSVQPIRCSACPARTAIHGIGTDAVYSRTALWSEGWRRDPASRLHYCPTCAPEGLA